MIPEIGLEVEELGRRRPDSGFGYHSIVVDAVSAWSLIAVSSSLLADRREPLVQLLNRDYQLVSLNDWPDWKHTFALSMRIDNAAVSVLESRKVHSITLNDGKKIPDLDAARQQLKGLLKSHVSEPINYQAEFRLTHTLHKSKAFVLPLDLARYAAIFYLSSLVRYKPSALDGVYEGTQSWLMDSLSREVPINLLAGSLMGILGTPAYFESTGYRT